MRGLFALGGILTLALLTAPLPAGAQDLPGGVPHVDKPPLPAPPSLEQPGVAAPDFVGSYQGVVYAVKDGLVERLDGGQVDPAAAVEILKARRVHDLLERDPGLLDRLRERAASPPDAEAKLAEARTAVENLRATAQSLTPDVISALLGGLLGRAPIDANQILAEASAVESKAQEARAHADRVKAVSEDAQATVEAFRQSHSVEDKRAVVESFLAAIPEYRAAAAKADEARARAEAAKARVESLLAGVAPDPANLSVELGIPPQVPLDLATAQNQLQGYADDVGSKASALRSDAEYMQGLAEETPPNDLPVGWIVGGGAGAAAAGLGSLWWVRRRLGLF